MRVIIGRGNPIGVQLNEFDCWLGRIPLSHAVSLLLSCWMLAMSSNSAAQILWGFSRVAEKKRGCFGIKRGRDVLTLERLCSSCGNTDVAMLQTLAKGLRRVFTKGPIDTARWSWYHVYERFREWRLGIETEECDAWQDSFEDKNYHVYQPLCYSCIDTAILRLDIRPGEDVFLDYGSGKGRIATVAATHRFKKVIGVEMLADLNETARANIRRAVKRLKCRDVEFIQTDATKYELPSDVTVVFMFNPFLGDVLKAVQQQIRASLESHPRQLQLVYINPLEQPDLFEDCDWLVKLADLPVGRWEKMRFRLYGTFPSNIPLVKDSASARSSE